MRLVHHQQVPARVEQLPCALGIARQPAGGGDHALLVFEGVGAGRAHLDRFAALFVEDGEAQVEAAQQLHEPLVHEAFRHQDQHPRGATRGQLLRDDEAGLDGLAEPDFIGKQQARRSARGGDPGHAQLVRDQVDARAQDAGTAVRLGFGPASQALAAQVELLVAVDAPAHEAGIGLRHRLLGVELAFGDQAPATAIHQEGRRVLPPRPPRVHHRARASGRRPGIRRVPVARNRWRTCALRRCWCRRSGRCAGPGA
jgi:hypothetical protein